MNTNIYKRNTNKAQDIINLTQLNHIHVEASFNENPIGLWVRMSLDIINATQKISHRML
jgi:hypothetical protein